MKKPAQVWYPVSNAVLSEVGTVTQKAVVEPLWGSLWNELLHQGQPVWRNIWVHNRFQIYLQLEADGFSNLQLEADGYSDGKEDLT